MSGSQMKIILQVKGKDVQRKFAPSFLKTKYGADLKALSKFKDQIKPIFSGLDAVIEDIFSDEFKWFYDFKDMPWYLDLIAQRIIKQPRCYKLRIKSCKGYLFFDVSYTVRGNKRLPLLSPFFHDATLPTTPDQEEKIRGVADTLLFLAPTFLKLLNQSSSEKGDLLRDAFDWFDIVLTIDKVKTLPKNEHELTFTTEVNWDAKDILVDAEGIHLKKAIPIYSPSGKSKQVIVASPNVRDAINKLSEAWHNPAASTILLSASPGSGKDVLSDVLMYALSLNRNQVMTFAAPHLASSGSPLHQIRAELSKNGLINNKRLPDGENTDLTKDCLLFFDEIHHDIAKPLREILLRFLETKELQPSGNNGRVVDCKKMKYLFAASKPLEVLESIDPPDFWTRIEYRVVMRHPLLLKTQPEINDVLQQFFYLFWHKAIRDLHVRIAAHRFNLATEITELLSQQDSIEQLSKKFARTLDSPLIPTISIRTLRSIVNRLASRSIYHVQTKRVKDGKIIEELGNKFDEWLIDIFKSIVPEIQVQGVF